MATLAGSNVLATVLVTGLPIVGWRWVAPALTPTMKNYFFALTIWGLPFVIGQYSQEDEWGSIWVQYHLLDLSYAPWGTGLVLGTFVILRRLLERSSGWAQRHLSILSSTPRGASAVVRRLLNLRLTDEVLLRGSFGVIIGFGYVSEFWDSMWSWHTYGSLASAFDMGDYATITIGGAATVALYLWFRQATLKGVMS